MIIWWWRKISLVAYVVWLFWVVGSFEYNTLLSGLWLNVWSAFCSCYKDWAFFLFPCCFCLVSFGCQIFLLIVCSWHALLYPFLLCIYFFFPITGEEKLRLCLVWVSNQVSTLIFECYVWFEFSNYDSKSISKHILKTCLLN